MLKNEKKCNNNNINKFKDINKIIENIDSFEKYDITNKNENKINQLFSKEPPPFSLVQKILFELINKNLNDYIYYEFTIKSLINKRILEKINLYIPELKKYYLKCKFYKYLENLTEKKIVTLFRQILKPYGFSINTIEKYNDGEKYLLYIIEKKQFIGIKKINSLINFD
jgi:hypothetical protein